MFAVAPMMDWTDRHCRAFHRRLTAHALLYTEMVTADAVIFGPRERLLGFDPIEHPIAVQLGGSDPEKIARAAAIAAEFGYDEINLNVGCPSDRVQNGRFGACLMREPSLVGELYAAMRQGAPNIPATIKCRIGVDDQDPEQALFALVDASAAQGCARFVVHARKAWLKGLSPKENREIPPLDYDLVRRLKAARPHLAVILNGGLDSVAHGLVETEGLDGMMLGRAAYKTPCILLDVDTLLHASPAPARDGVDAIERHKPYLARALAAGTPLHVLTKPMLGLFHGRPGGRLFRRVLSEEGVKPGAGLEVVAAAVETVTRVSEAA